MQTKTTDTMTMTSNNKQIVEKPDLLTGLIRLVLQCNRAGTKISDKKEKIKSPRFAFLEISAIAHCTQLLSRNRQHSIQALQKSAILPTHLINIEKDKV